MPKTILFMSITSKNGAFVSEYSEILVNYFKDNKPFVMNEGLFVHGEDVVVPPPEPRQAVVGQLTGCAG